ncbi:MAG: rod shape-determining protein MreC [Natronospirillum sp.]|uniref:rod shape-determining protein MreC n=1 Tax=Natronospirillum sp. TaxID=2812955 RepID=UPI0025CD964B|nr:rod shape-determining protein MreC [Natronospirillum sp.]MCH8550890.1 rod shape-determining protein MreC [Natronospirillum sp.]
MSTSLFQERRVYGKRFLWILLLAGALLLADWRFAQLEYVRQGVSATLAPIRLVASIPSSIADWASRSVASRASLIEENAQLRAQLFVLERRSQQMISLEIENRRLRQLLNATEVLEDRFISAELIGVDPDPFTHHVILNRGTRDNVYVGQPVIDANGLVGQVIEVDPFTSRVLLIGDANHAVPVQVNRNGVRTTVTGTGDLTELSLMFVPETADIQEGDLLVTSGLGGRFPMGYPVAEVSRVERIPGAQFSEVRARPLAELDRTRHVLLVDTQNNNRNRRGDTQGE